MTSERHDGNLKWSDRLDLAAIPTSTDGSMARVVRRALAFHQALGHLFTKEKISPNQVNKITAEDHRISIDRVVNRALVYIALISCVGCTPLLAKVVVSEYNRLPGVEDTNAPTPEPTPAEVLESSGVQE